MRYIFFCFYFLFTSIVFAETAKTTPQVSNGNNKQYILPQNILKDVELSRGITGKIQIWIEGKSWHDPVTAIIKILENDTILYSSDKITYILPDEFNLKDNPDGVKCLNFEDCQKIFFLDMPNRIVMDAKKQRYTVRESELTRQAITQQIIPKNVSDTEKINSFISYLNTESYNQFFIPAGVYKVQAILVYSQQFNKMIDINTE